MAKLSFEDTMPATGRQSGIEAIPVSAIADLILLALARRRAAAVVIEPQGDRHVVSYELGGTMLTLSALESAVADAVVARFAILADLDVGARADQVGRVRVRVAKARGTGPITADLLVVVRAAPDGLIAEIRRIASADDDARAAIETGDDGGATAGSYRILGELGRGGMGIVYRAEHVVLQKIVALKALHPGLARDPEISARFVLEARAACRARHPGIIDVTDFGLLPDGRAFLVMELCEGMTLEALLREGPLDMRRAIEIARQMADALRAAIASGVVHRDLKPANVFVGPGDRVKIGDFGLAKVIDQANDGATTNPRGAIVGTAWYMSPEQARGGATDGRSDIYALGCVLFEMLTGRVPFAGTSIVGVLTQHLASPIPSLRGPEGPLPEALGRIVWRAMAKRPEERYQTAGEMLADLDRAARAAARGGWRRWLPT